MPPKKCLQQTIDELDQRSFRLKLLVKVQECNVLLKKHPHLATSTLENLKKRVKEQEQAEADGSSLLTPQPKRVKKATEELEVAEADDESTGTKVPGVVDAGGFCALEGHSLTHLRSYLNHLEPSVFNSNNMKNLLVRGQRVVGKKVLCEYLEWSTGLPSSWSPTGTLRLKQVLLEYMQRYVKRGCRAASMVLPCNWSRNGLYTIVRKNGDIFVQHNFTKEQYGLKAKELSTVKDPATLRIADNWSETQARLVEGSPHGIDLLLSSVFTEQEVVAASGLNDDDGDGDEDDIGKMLQSQQEQQPTELQQQQQDAGSMELLQMVPSSTSSGSADGLAEQQQQQQAQPCKPSLQNAKAASLLEPEVKKEASAKMVLAKAKTSEKLKGAGSVLQHLRKGAPASKDESKAVPSR